MGNNSWYSKKIWIAHNKHGTDSHSSRLVFVSTHRTLKRPDGAFVMELMLLPLFSHILLVFFGLIERTEWMKQANSVRFVLGWIWIFRAGGPRSGEYCANWILPLWYMDQMTQMTHASVVSVDFSTDLYQQSLIQNPILNLPSWRSPEWWILCQVNFPSVTVMAHDSVSLDFSTENRNYDATNLLWLD